MIDLLKKLPKSSGPRESAVQIKTANNYTEPERIGILNNIKAQVPPYLRGQKDVDRFRMSLPIWSSREDIIRAIDNNAIILISGETGSGKTTQVPQFILEHHATQRKPCRIIAAEPRRLAAFSVAERVSYERGEELGGTVGYQIRLEKKYTLIIFKLCLILI